MPYIKEEDRVLLDPFVEQLALMLGYSEDSSDKDGKVNYVISKLFNLLYNKPSYSVINRGIGVLESAKLEFYRRVAVPYEDKKKLINGDVYTK